MNFDKINDRFLKMFENREFDKEFINLELSKDVDSKLFDYQHLHVYNLISCLKKSFTSVAVDGSSTGAGKSYTSIAVCKQLNLTPLIITPKSILGEWKHICQLFNVKPIGIINYEMLKNGNYYGEDEKKVETPFMEITEKGDFKWKFTDPKKILVIFDEAHKCKNKTSLNGKLLISLKNITRVLLLSATLADTPANFQVFGYMLGFYDTLRKAKNWINGVILEEENTKEKNILNKKIFPIKGSRMTLEDIGEKFPKNQISAECYTLNKKDELEIDKECDVIMKEYENLKGKNSAGSLVKILRARQKIELLKIPIILELIDKYLELNRSVVVFVNFIDSLNKIKKSLDKAKISYSFIEGSQGAEERKNNIDSFQNNKNRVIVSMVQAGGQSINLHDTDGKFPRISIISPSFSSIELKQALGRIYRVGTKSPVLQRIVFCSNTKEERVCENIRTKLKFMTMLNDDDLIKF